MSPATGASSSGTQKRGRRFRSRVSAGIAALLAAGSAFVAVPAANAVGEPALERSLAWGISDSWRDYVTGATAQGDITAEAPATEVDDIVTWADGSGVIDVAAGSGTIAYEGAMVSQGHDGLGPDGGWGLNQVLDAPEIEVTSTTTAVLSAEVTQPAYAGLPEMNGERVLIADLAFAAGDLDDGLVVAAEATLTKQGAEAFGDSADELVGDQLDLVEFRFEVEASEQPENPPETPEEQPETDGAGSGADPSQGEADTQADGGSQDSDGAGNGADAGADGTAAHPALTVESESASITEGEDAVVTATVAPADIAGTLQFTRDGDDLGDPVQTDGEPVELTVSDLEPGQHDIAAIFDPDDAEAHASAQSEPISLTVKPRGAIETETLLEVSRTEAAEGDMVGLSATVSEAEAEGAIQFKSGGEALGEPQPATDGIVEIATTALPAGENRITAEFIPADESVYARSTSDAQVVVLADESRPSGEVKWGFKESWRNYVNGPIAHGQITAGEPATVEGNGVVTWKNGVVSDDFDAEAGEGSIAYEGAMISQGHKGIVPGQEFGLDQHLVDPIIEFTSTTTAELSAEVTQPSYAAWPEMNGERVKLVELEFPEGELEDADQEVDVSVLAEATLHEEGAAVYGNYGDYVAGTEVDDLAFTVSGIAELKDPTKIELDSSNATVQEGTKVKLDAKVADARTGKPIGGTVKFYSGRFEVSPEGGKAVNANGETTLVIDDLWVGEHALTARFTPRDDNYASRKSNTVELTVLSRNGGGGGSGIVGSMEWGIKQSFRTYVVGDIAQGRFTVSDGARQASGNGVFTYPQASSGKQWNGSTGTVQYAGNINIWGHHGDMNVNLPNPSIQVRNSSSADLRIPFQGRTITLATIDLGSAVKQNLSGDAVKFVGANVRLSADGANRVFVNDSGTGPSGTFYDPGEIMDRITFTIGEGSEYGLSGAQGGNASGGGSSTQEQATPAVASTSGGASGSLNWPISEAFVAYTTCENKDAFGYNHCAKGSIDTNGVGEGYVFPQAEGGTWDEENQTGSVEFSGVVKFNGYGLTMFQVANPSITVHSDSSATLYTGNDTRYGEASYSLDLSAGTKTEGSNGEVTWTDVPVDGTLVGTTASQAIGLDPLTFTVGDPSAGGFGSTEKKSSDAAKQKSAKSDAGDIQTVSALNEENPLLTAIFGPDGMQPWEWWASAAGLAAIAACTTLLALRHRRNAAAALSPSAS